MLMLWNNNRRARPGYAGAVSDLRRELDRVFDTFDRTSASAQSTRRAWPDMELTDNGDSLGVRVDLPGFVQEELEITMDRATLTIRGQRATQVPEGYSVHRQERGSLSFARTLTFPCRIDAERVDARMMNGVLHLTLPKVPEEQARTIHVNVN